MKNNWLSVTVIIVLGLAMSLSPSVYAAETTNPTGPTSNNNNEPKNDNNDQNKEPATTEVTKPAAEEPKQQDNSKPKPTTSKPEFPTCDGTIQDCQDKSRTTAIEPSPSPKSGLPKCDGSFQDCTTRNGDTCKAGEGGEKCECLPDMSDCQNHPSLHKSTPDASCDFHPNADKCKPDKDGNCPPGFSHNDKGNCHPSGPCPSGFHRVTDDESGTCFPNHTHRHHHPNHNTTPHTLKCDKNTDSSIPCIGWCSIANVDGTDFTSCFKTHKECNNFRVEHDGSKCLKTILHD